MPRVQQPGLKPTHKLVQAYYAALAQFDQHHVTRENKACLTSNILVRNKESCRRPAIITRAKKGNI